MTEKQKVLAVLLAITAFAYVAHTQTARRDWVQDATNLKNEIKRLAPQSKSSLDTDYLQKKISNFKSSMVGTPITKRKKEQINTLLNEAQSIVNKRRNQVPFKAPIYGKHGQKVG